MPYDSYSIHVDSEIKLLRNIKKFNRLPHVFLFKTGIALINPSDPLSTIDSTAFLSTIAPDSTAVAKIKINADSASVSKVYGIDTVLRYETPEGDVKYSDTLQAPIEVKEVGLFQKLFGWI